MEKFMRSLWTDESGQDLVEYVLIIVLIALGVAAAMVVLQQALSNVFGETATQLETQAGVGGDGTG